LTNDAIRLTGCADFSAHPEGAQVRESSVAGSIIIGIAEHLERGGVAREAFCRAARLDPSWMDRPHDRLPSTGVERVWQAAVSLSGDSLLGLHLSEHYRTGAISILGYVLLNCATVGEALDRLARYTSLMNDGLRTRADREGGEVVIRLEAIEGMENFLLRDARQVMEAMFSGVVLTIRQLTGAMVVPTRVMFAHAAGGDVSEYHRIFGTLVRFGTPEHLLAFSATVMDQPIRAADPGLLEVFERHAIGRLHELERMGNVSQRVTRLILPKLTGEVPTVEVIAAELAMSSRQLQRSLQEEGTSYRDLVEASRRELALARLRTPGTTASEVALLLGYSEAGAFTRAFRKWTGLTPGAYAAGAEPVMG
jgi:AraC-like DNA-binding protein